MRSDVKAGMALALIVVVLAGWYYAGDDTAQNAISLGEPSAQPESSPPVIEQPRIRRSQPAPNTERRSHTRSNASRDQSTVNSRRTPADASSIPLTASSDEHQSRSRTAITPVNTDAQQGKTLEIYTIQPGDTLAMLAKLYYGDSNYARFIHQANPHVRDPNAMPVGTEIRIPSVPKETQVANMLTAERDTARSRTSSSQPTRQSQPARTSSRAPTPAERTYTVRSGDSFYAIAEEVLGSGPRWKEIFELNRDLVKGDPQRLRPGMVLKIPAK